jgi:hypothetical protein
MTAMQRISITIPFGIIYFGNIISDLITNEETTNYPLLKSGRAVHLAAATSVLHWQHGTS